MFDLTTFVLSLLIIVATFSWVFWWIIERHFRNKRVEYIMQECNMEKEKAVEYEKQLCVEVEQARKERGKQ